MQAVGQFDQDDPDVLGHGQEHLAEILRLLLLACPESQARELGYPVDQEGDFLAEFRLDLPDLHRRIFNHVMKKGRHDGSGVHADLHEDLRHFQRVLDVVLSRIAALTLVSTGG